MKIIKEIISWMSYIFAGIIISLIINIFIIQPTIVEGTSMEPTLHDNKKLFINKTVNIFSYNPNYEDIIIIDSRVERTRTRVDDLIDTLKSNLVMQLVSKNQEHIYWIKRVIGKSGDVIRFENGKISRNGIVLVEAYIKEKAIYPKKFEVTVPEDSVFVMGDNRNNSSDSRDIGCIPLNHVVGKLSF